MFFEGCILPKNVNSKVVKKLFINVYDRIINNMMFG